MIETKTKKEGLDLFEKACRVFGTSLKSIKKVGEDEKLVESFSCANFDDLLIQIGAGKLDVKNVLTEVPSIKKKAKDTSDDDSSKKLEEFNSFSKSLSKRVLKKSQSDNAVIVDGLDDLLVRMARCCNPIPGDPILGYITRGRGVTIHTKSCSRVDIGEMSRTVSVEWNSGFNFKHPVTIRVITLDKPGILSLISNRITDQKINIRSALAKSLPDRKGSFVFEIEVKDYSELIKTINSIESLEEVISVSRV